MVFIFFRFSTFCTSSVIDRTLLVLFYQLLVFIQQALVSHSVRNINESKFWTNILSATWDSSFGLRSWWPSHACVFFICFLLRRSSRFRWENFLDEEDIIYATRLASWHVYESYNLSFGCTHSCMALGTIFDSLPWSIFNDDAWKAKHFQFFFPVVVHCGHCALAFASQQRRPSVVWLDCWHVWCLAQTLLTQNDITPWALHTEGFSGVQAVEVSWFPCFLCHFAFVVAFAAHAVVGNKLLQLLLATQCSSCCSCWFLSFLFFFVCWFWLPVLQSLLLWSLLLNTSSILF